MQTGLGPGSPEPLAGLPGWVGKAGWAFVWLSEAEDMGVSFPARAGGGSSHPAAGVAVTGESLEES